MDYIEYKLLNSLQKNARLTNLELAKQVGLSASPCLRRVKSLEESGVITGYSAIINQNKVHLSVNVFVQVSLERQSEERLQIFEEKIMEYREVMKIFNDCEADYLLRSSLKTYKHMKNLKIISPKLKG